MIEVDVFWSWAFGATFAACAAGALRHESSPINKYSFYNLLFLSLVFGPSGAYLLARFPGWESMWLLNADSCRRHPMLPTVFAHTNVLLGTIAFHLCHRAIRAGDDLRAHTHWVRAYSCFFAILGMGYYRFTYSGNENDWANGVQFPMVGFLTSEVFLTLLGMAVILLPAFVIPSLAWFAQSYPNAQAQQRVIHHVIAESLRCVAVISVAYAAVVLLGGADLSDYLSHGFAGPWAPLLGFLFAMSILYTLLVIGPFALAPTESLSKVNYSWSCMKEWLSFANIPKLDHSDPQGNGVENKRKNQ